MRCPACKIDMTSSGDQFRCPRCNAVWQIMPKEDFSGYYDDDEDYEWDKSVEEAGDYADFNVEDEPAKY